MILIHKVKIRCNCKLEMEVDVAEIIGIDYQFYCGGCELNISIKAITKEHILYIATVAE